MIIETRPSYPANKLTFSIANITKNKAIRFFDINLNLNGQFDVDVTLEDPNRNLSNSFIPFLWLLNTIPTYIFINHFKFTKSLSFTKRILYYNKKHFKGSKIHLKKDENNTMKEYYITFR